MTADEFAESVLFPAFNQHESVTAFDEIFGSVSQAGLTLEVVLDAGETFRVTVVPR